MELEDALFKWVSLQAGITANIGAAPQVVRFFKGKAPQGTKTPFMIQQRNGGVPGRTYCGIDGTVPVSLQIDTYAKDWASMAATARSLKSALRPDVLPGGYPTWMGDGDSPSVAVKVKAAILENEFDGEDPDPGLSRRTQLWTFWIYEP